MSAHRRCTNGFLAACKRILAKVNYGQAAVIVDAKSPINSLEQLKGKKLAGVKKGSGMDVLLRGYVLKKAGLNWTRTWTSSTCHRAT